MCWEGVRLVRVGGIWIALLAVVVLCGGAHGQYQPPSDRLWVSGERAATWQEGSSSVVLIEGWANQGSGGQGGVTIELDRGKMSADNAVVWLEPAPAEERMLD